VNSVIPLEVVEEWEDSSGGGYGLLQTQYWPLGLGPFGEIEVLYPLDDCRLSKEIDEWDYQEPLNWDCVEEEDPALVILDAVEEDFRKEVKVALVKYKGTRELPSLKSSVNYSDVFTSNRRSKGKAHER
jgi:hypothetical protein